MILRIPCITLLCYRLWITESMQGKVESLVQLPNWECEQCILQWTYRNGKKTIAILTSITHSCYVQEETRTLAMEPVERLNISVPVQIFLYLVV